MWCILQLRSRSTDQFEDEDPFDLLDFSCQFLPDPYLWFTLWGLFHTPQVFTVGEQFLNKPAFYFTCCLCSSLPQIPSLMHFRSLHKLKQKLFNLFWSITEFFWSISVHLGALDVAKIHRYPGILRPHFTLLNRSFQRISIHFEVSSLLFQNKKYFSPSLFFVCLFGIRPIPCNSVFIQWMARQPENPTSQGHFVQIKELFGLHTGRARWA